MTAAEVLRLTHAEYLKHLEASDERSEYWDGFVVAMTGGSVRHSFLGTQLSAEFRRILGKGPCRVFGPDLRIRVSAINGSFYPDVSVICGELLTAPDDPHGVINPTVVVEVVSPSSDRYDRGAKWNAYSHLDSLKCYLLVDARTGDIELLEKESATKWRRTLKARNEEGFLAMASLGVSLDLSEVYAGFDTLP
jgi:Uma2 family endonuclease